MRRCSDSADVNDLALEALGTFEERNAGCGDVALAAERRADQRHDQAGADVPRDFPWPPPPTESGIFVEPIGAEGNDRRDNSGQ